MNPQDLHTFRGGGGTPLAPRLEPTELDALLHRAALAPLSPAGSPQTARAFLRVTGSDATRWLNGMVTNSVQALAPGHGAYNFLLNAQGRIQGDCTVFRDPTPDPASFLLATDASQLEALGKHLDGFIIMDDVELAPALTADSSLLLLGPEAPGLLRSSGLPTPEPLRLSPATTPHGPLLILTPPPSTTPAFELRADTGTLLALRSAFLSAGASEVSPAALEALRILQGRPRFGLDIRNSDTARDLPQETNQPHALHFSKGCYLGQEIVERIRSRGQVHRLFTPLTLIGDLPSVLPSPLSASGKPAGEITSAVQLPDGTLLALGYVRREALDTHQPLSFPGGTASPRPVPSPVSPSLPSASNFSESVTP
jgi:folate-binding protein YgfZ